METQYVDIEVFVTVAVAVLGLIVGGFVLMLKQIGTLRDAVNKQSLIVAEVKKENESDQRNIDGLWDTVKSNIEEMKVLKEQRTGDVIQFTEIIGKLNTTLGKMEVTLENTNSVMVKVEKRLEDQDREIRELKKK